MIQESAQKSASAFVDKYYKYDNRNRAYAVSDGERYTKYLFDNKGNITKSVYGLQNYNTNISTGYTPPNATYTSVVYAYDELDRLISKTDYLGTEYYEYDLAGNMTESTDAAGNVTAQSFDAKGNLLSSTVNSADAITYTYNFYSWLTSTTRGNDTISYSYDNLGRVVSEANGGVVKNYSYDIAGNMKHFELVEDNTTTLEVDYTYDILNRMSSAVNVGGGLDSDATSAVENADVTVNYAYNGNSLITLQTVGQYVTSYAYNGANLLTNLTNSRNSTTLSAFDYTYYLSGNISGVTDTRQSQPTRTYAYTYNDRNMLTNATKTVGTDVTEWIYAYDADGDRTTGTITLNGNTQQSTAYTYTAHKLTGTTLTDTANSQTVATAYTYDTRGNQVGQTVTTTPNNGTPSVVATANTYNSRNELVGKTDGTNTYAYSYDANGLRNSKTVNGATTNYIWSGQNIVSENTSATNTYYFYGLNRVSRKIMGTAYEGLNEDWDNNDDLLYSYAYDGLLDYYLYDGHGSVVQTYDPNRDSQVSVHFSATANSTNYVPELDYSGNSWIDLADLNYYNQSYPIVDNYYYDPFGELEATPDFDTNPYRYCGEYWDSESGEIYLRARYYNPRTGRFNRIDPIRDGVNWYVYCWNNPIMYIDPWGLFDYDTKLTYSQEYNVDVEVLQHKLESLGYIDMSDGGWGYFGTKTLAAVNAYKNDAGLWNFGEYEGVVGVTTWTHLGLIYRTQEDIDAGVEIITIFRCKQYKDFSLPINNALATTIVVAEQYNELPMYGIMDAGIRLAAKGLAGLWFAEQVNHYKPWDIKRESPWNETIGTGTYPGWGIKVYYNGWIATPEELGNYTYGYIGHALGFSLPTLYAGSWYAAGFPASGDELQNELTDWNSICKGYNGYSSTR